MNNEEYNRGVFEGEVLAELRTIKKLGDDVRSIIKCHEDRLTLIELNNAWAKGVTIGIGAVAGIASSFIAKYLAILFKGIAP